jgi:hypothetical protein
LQEGGVVPADDEMFVEEGDAIGEQLEQAEGAHGGIGEALW